MTVEEDLVPEVGAVPTETLRVFGRTAPDATGVVTPCFGPSPRNPRRWPLRCWFSAPLAAPRPASGRPRPAASRSRTRRSLPA